MKAYKIHDDIVAAHNPSQAITTWAEHFEERIEAAGPVAEIDPTTYIVAYEQEDGTFENGPLTEMMPAEEPQVLLTEGEW